MSKFYALEVVNADAVETKENTVSVMLGRVRKEVEARIAFDAESGNTPKNDKEYDPLRALRDDRTFAAYCVAFKRDPRVLINSAYMTDSELSKSGLDPVQRQRNLKAIAKHAEIARLVMRGSMHNEPVMHTFTACALLSSRFGTLPREVVKTFISTLSARSMNPELADAVERYRAKHMTGGTDTQTSQNTLTLSLHGVLIVERDGRSRKYRLNRESDVTQAIANRYGLEVA